MLLTVNGLVIREIIFGESDKILTILTAEYGKISFHAYGVRRYKSPHFNSTQLFCFGEYVLDKYHEINRLRDSAVIESFYDLRLDLYKTAFSQYIMEIVNDVCVEGEPEEVMLRLTLNALHMLVNSNRPVMHIKAIYELRTAANIGFLPDLIYCGDCGVYESEYMYFNIMNANLLCDKCFANYSLKIEPVKNDADENENENEPEFDSDGTTMIIKLLPLAIVKAMRHVVYSNARRIYSFSLSDDLYPVFADVCESYLLNHIERGFKTLEFYKKLL